MKISLCITTFNEEKSIDKLLKSIFKQTKEADEVIIVDAGSTDKTIELIRKYKKIKLIISKGASIAKGRNLAVRNAKSSVIAMTDAGCILRKDWLEKIVEPLMPQYHYEGTRPQVVAGFYNMTGNSKFQKSLKQYLGVLPKDFNENFLPSTRSIAFKKKVWKEIGGFDERFDKAGEDTEFNIQISKYSNIRIVRVKSARVDWEVPDNLKDAFRKFFYYARGDAQNKNLQSKHNLHTLTIFARYILFLIFWPSFFVYIIYAYWKAGPWGIIIQLASDFAIMAGATDGIFSTNS